MLYPVLRQYCKTIAKPRFSAGLPRELGSHCCTCSNPSELGWLWRAHVWPATNAEPIRFAQRDNWGGLEGRPPTSGASRPSRSSVAFATPRPRTSPGARLGRGPGEDTLMLTPETVAANLRLARHWARLQGKSLDPSNVAFADGSGFEELDADGQIRRVKSDRYSSSPGWSLGIFLCLPGTS